MVRRYFILAIAVRRDRMLNTRVRTESKDILWLVNGKSGKRCLGFDNRARVTLPVEWNVVIEK